MSRKHEETIGCSSCRTQQDFTVWDSVNVSVDPSLKQSLLDGDLTTFRCPRCRHEAHVAYDCLYHDMDSSLAVWLKYPEPHRALKIDPAATAVFSKIIDNYTCRIVASFHELLDKIRVFDDGFTDHTIELAKLLICIREGIDIACPFHYAAVESSLLRRRTFVFALETEDGFSERRYPMQQCLDSIKPLMPRIAPLIDATTDEWPHVNRSYMLQALEGAGLMRALQ